MIFKIMGIALIILSTSAVGVLLSKGLSNRAKQLEQLLMMLEKLQTYIRYSHTRVKDIVAELEIHFSEFAFLGEVSTLLEQGVPFPTAWKQGVERTKGKLSLIQSDMVALLQLGEIIGASDVDGQLSAIELTANLLKQNLVMAQEDRQRKGKMYRSLGFLLGLLIAVILV